MCTNTFHVEGKVLPCSAESPCLPHIDGGHIDRQIFIDFFIRFDLTVNCEGKLDLKGHFSFV